MCQTTSNPQQSSGKSCSNRMMTTTTKPSDRYQDGNRMEAISDVLHAMQTQQSRYTAIQTKVLSTANASPWRPMMVEWICSVVDTFDLMPWIVSTTLYYVDTASPVLAPIHRPSDYQLLGLTSLQLAIKVHETKVFPMEDLVKIGHGGFTTQQVVAMEAKLLQVLQFQLHPPSPECFLQQYLQLLPTCSSKTQWVYSTCFPMIRKGLRQQFPVPHDILAYASLLVAMEQAHLSTRIKQQVCWDMVTVTGLSAMTPGLAGAYQALLPRKPSHNVTSSSPTALRPPPSIVSSPSCDSLPSTSAVAPTNSHSQAVVYCATEGTGFEVTWYKVDKDGQTSKQKEALSLSWSPRNVSGLQ